MIKPINGSSGISINTSTTTYYTFDSGMVAAPSTVVAGVSQPVSIAGQISNLTVNLTVAPGVGNSMAYTLYVNSSATALTCTVSGTSTTASDTTHSVTVAIGDVLSWQAVPSGTPAASRFALSATFEGTSSGECSLSGGSGSSGTNTSWYQGVYGGAVNATESLAANIMPTAGVIDQLYVVSSGSVTTGISYVITLYKNGSATSLTATIAGTATTANDTTHSVSYSAGDTISYGVTMINGPLSRIIMTSVRFTPSIDGESPLFNTTTSWTNSAARFNTFLGIGSNTSTESNVQSVAPIAFTLKKLYTSVDVAPTGATKSWTIVSRKNAGVGNLSAAIVDTATAANDSSNSDSIAAGDLIDWRVTPTNTPSAIGRGSISGVMYIAPSNPSVNSAFFMFM